MVEILIDQIFEDIVETIREPLLVLNSDLKVISANRSFYEFFKVKPEETLGQLIYDLGNKQWDIPKLRELLETILPQKATFDNYEVEHDFATIGRRIMLLNARQIERVLGKERIILLAIEDITERRDADVLLSISEEQYRRLFETADDGILLLEKSKLKIRHANPAIMAMLGYSNEELIEKDMKDIGFPDDIGTFQEIIQALKKDGISHCKDVVVQNKAGQSIYTDIYMADRAILVQCNIRDITDRKQLEEELRQSHKMEAIGTIAGGVAHDFNNMLSIILGNTELAMDDVPEWNPARINLEEIKTASLRAKDVVRQLLSFSRKTDQEQKPVKINPVVTGVLKLLRSSIPSSIEIRSNIPNKSQTILADPTQINQVMINLCTNAAHAMEKDGGILEISLESVTLDDSMDQFNDLSSGRYVKLTVSDTGHGIDPEIKNRIFDPYFTTREVGKGSGMGLAVVQGIVMNHDGAITVDSEVGKGSTFKVFLPIVRKEPVPEITIDEDFPTGKERILFVDDEESIVRMGTQRLERLGYQVESTTSPLEALNLFRSKPDQFDLVITDLTMPKMTGDKLVKEILNIRPGMPIIICTGFSERMDGEKAMAIGAAGYLAKPHEKRELAMTVKKVLGGK